MGERLNIEIVKGEKVLANAYYHWRGFTRTTMETTNTILKAYSRIKTNVARSKSSNKDLLFAIRLLETTGAGIDFSKKENDFVCKIGKEFKCMQDRNEGIIGVTKKDIEETRTCEEERVTIDIESEEVSFEAFMEYDEEEIQEMLEDYDKDKRKIGKINVDNYKLTFEQCFELEKTLNELAENDTYCVYNSVNNEYLWFVE